MAEALIDLPDAWSDTARKFRTPQDWLVAMLRAFNADDVNAAVMLTGASDTLNRERSLRLGADRGLVIGVHHVRDPRGVEPQGVRPRRPQARP